MAFESSLAARLHSPETETGGILLGEIDNACQVVWVDRAIGPAPDSELGPTEFRHGTAGVEDCIVAFRNASQERTYFVGMWHTHPAGGTEPSARDQETMLDFVDQAELNPSAAVLVVIGGDPKRWRDRARPVLPGDHGQAHQARSTTPA